MIRQKIIFCYLAIIVYLICIGDAFSQDPKSINWRLYNSHEWVKNIDPNSSTWKNLSKEERLQLFQIPDVELKQMSTEELTIACLNSRFTKLFFLYSNVNDYYKQLDRFNGFHEFLKRKDAAKTLLNLYKNINPETSQMMNEFRFKKKNILRWLELYLGHETIQKQLNASEIRLLLKELRDKYEIKKRNSVEYSIVGLCTNIYTISRTILLTLNRPDYTNRLHNTDGLNDLIMTANIHEDNLAAEILQITDDFLLNK